MKKSKQSRRQFLKRSAGVTAGIIGFPYLIPSSVFGRNGTPPSDKITIGCIGYGMMGSGNTKSFLNEPDAKVVAMCDLDDHWLSEGKNAINNHYGNKDCVTYHDYRELMIRKDIDVMSIAIPDHWHAIVSIAAARAGKDIYGEKPLSHSEHKISTLTRIVKENTGFELEFSEKQY